MMHGCNRRCSRASSAPFRETKGPPVNQPLTLEHPTLRTPPGPRLWGLLRRATGMAYDPLPILERDCQYYGDVVRYRRITMNLVVLRHPDHVRHVLESHHTNFCRSVMYDYLKPVLGQGLLTADGAPWQRQRRIVQPYFSRQRTSGSAGIMVDETRALLERWEQGGVAGTPLDIHAAMMHLTLVIAGRVFFDVDVREFTKTVGKALHIALKEVDRRADELFNWPHWLPTPRNRRFNEAVKTLDEVVYRIIATRRAQKEPGNDLLSMLIQAGNADGGMTDRQLRDEVTTLLLAGHETTANWLSWTLYLLAKHPDVDARLADELGRVLDGRLPTEADLARLPYLKQVGDESLRLYPPAWMFDRATIADDRIGGFHIKAGSIVLLSPYLTHRHPEFWPDPTRFDPERFRAELTHTRPRHAFFPFGGGPRLCVGAPFAMLEGLLILAAVVSRFRFAAVENHPVEPEAGITLRPRFGIQLVPFMRDR
jgi:cytochrome P450